MKALGIIFSNIHERDIPELTRVRTLASVPFGGRYRLIDFVLSNMVNSGITNIGIIAKYNYQSLMDHVQSGKSWGLARKNGGLTILPPFTVVDANESGGVFNNRFEAIKSVENFIRHNEADYVVMSDCDVVCNFDFAPAIKLHEEGNADITLIYRKKVLDSSDKYRTIVQTEGDRVVKVMRSDGLSGEQKVYTDFMIISRRTLLYIIENSDKWGVTSFSRDILSRTDEYKILAHELDGYYAAINSLNDYYKHTMELLNPQVVRDLFYKGGAEIYTKVRDSAPARFTDSATVKNSLIADGCVVEGEVENSVLFRGVHVAKGAKISGSIIMQDSQIDAGSMLNCVIMDKGAHVLDGRLLSGHLTHPYYIEKETTI